MSSVRLDWIHPSVRDTTIGFLMDHDVDRKRFLRSATASGVLLAISSAGGASGTRLFPLLKTDDDWEVLAARLAELAASEESAEAVLALLQGIEDALATAAELDLDLLPRLQSLTRSLLDALHAAWAPERSEAGVAALRLYYALSVDTQHLVPSPDLWSVWERVSRDSDEVVASQDLPAEASLAVSRLADLISLLQQYEPRFLMMVGFEDQIQPRVDACYSALRTRVALFEELQEDEEEYADGHWIPVDPDSDEWQERQWLAAFIPVAGQLAALPHSATDSAELEAAMEEHETTRRRRQSRREEFESSAEDDSDDWTASRDQGSGDFDVAAFFADL